MTIIDLKDEIHLLSGDPEIMEQCFDYALKLILQEVQNFETNVSPEETQAMPFWAYFQQRVYRGEFLHKDHPLNLHDFNRLIMDFPQLVGSPSPEDD